MLEKIQKKFDKAALTYDSFATVQFNSAKILTEYVSRKIQPKTVLDLGCGTGFVTKLLLNKFPKATFTLNDISADMLLVAKKTIGHDVKIIKGNMEEIDFEDHDLIISNLSFQWLENMDETVRNLKKRAKVLAFSCILDGTFDEWKTKFLESGLKSPVPKYPKKEELDGVFYTKDFILYFKNYISFMKYLKKIGASYSKNSYSVNFFKNFTEDAPLKITYKVGFCMI